MRLHVDEGETPERKVVAAEGAGGGKERVRLAAKHPFVEAAGVPLHFEKGGPAGKFVFRDDAEPPPCPTPPCPTPLCLTGCDTTLEDPVLSTVVLSDGPEER